MAGDQEQAQRERRNATRRAWYQKDRARISASRKARRDEIRESIDYQMTTRLLNDRHFTSDDRALVDRIFTARKGLSGMARLRAEHVLKNFRNQTPMRGWQDEANAALGAP